MIPVIHYLFLSFSLLLIGIVGATIRRNILIKLFSVELILVATSINLAAFARLFGDAAGQTFAVFTIAITGAEFLVGAAIFAAIFRRWHAVPVPAAQESPRQPSVNY
jgi:NADH-quinone oxidoreductase subunit K